MTGEDFGDAAATPAELEAATALIHAWAAAELDTNPLLAHVEHHADDHRWLLRMRGEDKAVITVWLTLRERTLHAETYFIPAPEENVASCYEYLLRLNARLHPLRFSIGDEDAVFLSGYVPVNGLDRAALDHVLGAAYQYTEQYFRTALSLGFASRVK